MKERNREIDSAADGERAEINQYKTVLDRRPCVKEAGTQRAELPSAVNVKSVST